LSWANAHPAFMTVQVIPPNYSRAGTALRPQLAKQAAPQPARQPAPQLGRVPQLVRQSTPQVSKQPASKVVQSTPKLSRQPAPKVGQSTRSLKAASSAAQSGQPRRSRPELRKPTDRGANPSRTPDQAQDVSVELIKRLQTPRAVPNQRFFLNPLLGGGDLLQNSRQATGSLTTNARRTRATRALRRALIRRQKCHHSFPAFCRIVSGL
jgi:hypothetical protein